MTFRNRLPALVAGSMLLMPFAAFAQMSLTAAGVSDGFTLSTFVSGLPSYGTNSEGPFGVASTSDGHILVDSSPNSTIYVFKDVDGQTPAAALSSSTFASFASALTNAGGTIYGSGGLGALLDSHGGPDAYNLLQFGNNGSLGGTVLANAAAAGVAANPINGHIIAVGASNFLFGVPLTETLLDVNPVTKTATTIASWSSRLEGDGLVVSADGKTVYVAFKTTPTINGYDIATGSLVFSKGIADTPDGMGIIQGTSKFAGDLVVNTNEGTVLLVNPKDVTQTPVVIASGGSRGDYTGQDLLNGSLFLTQTDEVLRLSCGTGCGFGGATGGGGGGGDGGGGGTGVPEPASLALLGLGFVGLALTRRRRTN